MNKNEPLIVHDQQIYGSELMCSILGELFLWKFDEKISVKTANRMLQVHKWISSFLIYDPD